MTNFEVAYVSLIVIAYAGAMVVLLVWLKKRRKEREKRDTEFVSSLVKAIQNGSIQHLKDVNDLFCAFFKVIRQEYIEADRIGLFLRRTKHTISVEMLDPGKQRSALLDIVNSLITKNEEILANERQRLPFSGVPSHERSLLEDILQLSSSEDKAYVREKLENLASAIKIRQETINQLSEEKGRSLKWAKWGVFGTIVFSLISIV